MASGVDPRALDRLYAECLRILAAQSSAYESALRRVGDLLRLSVAALAGILVVVGIVSTSTFHLDSVGLGLFSLGVACAILSAFLSALVLAGDGRSGDLIVGPDPATMVRRVEEPSFTEGTLLGSLVQASALWLESNRAVLARIEKRRAWALGMLVPGVLLILAGLLYMAAGGIHV